MARLPLRHVGEPRREVSHPHSLISKMFGIQGTLHHEVLPLVNIGGIYIQHTVHRWKSGHWHHFQDFTDIEVIGNHIGNLFSDVAFVGIDSHIGTVRHAGQAHIGKNGLIRTSGDIVVAVEGKLTIGNDGVLRIKTEIHTSVGSQSPHTQVYTLAVLLVEVGQMGIHLVGFQVAIQIGTEGGQHGLVTALHSHMVVKLRGVLCQFKESGIHPHFVLFEGIYMTVTPQTCLR